MILVFFLNILNIICVAPFLLFVTERENYFLGSPAIIFAIMGLILGVAYDIKKYLLILCVLVSGALYFYSVSESNVIYKIFFIYGSILGVLVTSHLKFNSEDVLKILAITILLEAFCRFAFVTKGYDGIYSLKDTFYLYPDTNYIGVVSLILIVSATRIGCSACKYLYIGGIISFSRMSWILIAFNYIANRNKVLIYLLKNKIVKAAFFSLFAIIIITYSVWIAENHFLDPDDFIDNSLLTKLAIAYSFKNVLIDDISLLLVGFGDLGSSSIVKDYTSMAYTGHTFFGIILQYGVLGLLYIAILPIYIMNKLFGKSDSLFYILFSGFLSFYPATLFPVLYFVCTESFYAKRSK